MIPVQERSQRINDRNLLIGWSYDADGRVTNDGRNTYAYDAEGRVKLLNGTTAYIYDAEGRRVGKGTFSGVQLDETNFYLLGPAATGRIRMYGPMAS